LNIRRSSLVSVRLVDVLPEADEFQGIEEAVDPGGRE
jgi:hypothetical protein